MSGGAPPVIDDTHNPARRSWVASANSGAGDFPIQNLPYGLFRAGPGDAPRIGVAIGEHILDLTRAVESGLFEGVSSALSTAAAASSLSPIMALQPPDRSRLRRQLVKILDGDGWGGDPGILVKIDDAELLLPTTIGDYTDFYASIFHATHVGSLFRPDNPLLPNYRHVPIAYHGRSSSIVISGTPVSRPAGQRKGADDRPVFGPTERLDYEAEVGFIVGTGNRLGEPVQIDDAESCVFGVCLVNDWSARDIQAWEYQPLGPFLAKSFATTMSPWIVTLEALAPYRTSAFKRSPGDPPPLPYLSSSTNDATGGFDITVEVSLRSAKMREGSLPPFRVSRGSFRHMYWTLAQMVAHHTSNGCNLRPGDLLASGTVSGADRGTEGCLLELTRHGPLELPSGESRTYLADGDEVVIRAVCEREGFVRIGFGECRGTVKR